jgi:DNA-binding transcriptional LysR family regulator
MRFQEIETFRALMQFATTHRAAEALGVTQPAVSQALKRLEKAARLSLFERRSGRLVPTPEAKALMAEVDRVFLGMESIEHRLASLRDFGVNRLDIASFPAFGLGFLPRALARYRQSLSPPWPHLSLQVQSSKDVRAAVAMGVCDFGLMADEVLLDGIDHSVFSRFDGVMVMPEDHALTKYKIIHIEQLADQALLALNPEDTSRTRFEAVLNQYGVQLKVAVNTPYAASICELALCGLGVGLVNPITALDYAKRGLAIRQLNVQIPFTCLLAVPAGKIMSTNARALLMSIRQQLASDEARLLDLGLGGNTSNR